MSSLRSFLSLLIIVFFLCVSSMLLAGGFVYPYGHIQPSPLPKYALMDLSGAMAGARRLGADIAWIQLLQYYGSTETPVDKDAEYQLSCDMVKYLFGQKVSEKGEEDGCSEEGHFHPNLQGGVYQDLYRHCQRVVQLDPFFSFAYLYGAGSLGWNLNRPDEAIELLRSGISNMENYKAEITKDPRQPYWQFHLYLAALTYTKTGESDKMRELLETAVLQPECPNMVKVLLANIYQKDSLFLPALKLWLGIYDSGDPSYSQRSAQKIAELRKLANLTPS